MQHFFIFLTALAGFALAPLGQADTRPNIVFIIADDLAWDDLGCSGNPNVRTPHLDRLAKGGMQFTNAFLTISSCSPSRASIITGTYPHQTDAEQLHWPVPADQLTFVELLKASGYWTAAAGKWHLGNAVKDRFNEVREADVSGFQLPTGEAAKKGRIIQKVIGDARHSADRMWTERRPGRHVSRDDKRSVSVNVKGGSLCRRRNVRQHARGCRLDGKMHDAAIETVALAVVDPDGGSRQTRLAPA